MGKIYFTIHEMCMVVMQTAEPDSTKENTEILVKIIDSTYYKAYHEHVEANAFLINY